MKKQLLLRVEESQLDKIKKAAEYFHESPSAFLLNAALLRMQTNRSPEKLDPFDQALQKLRQTLPELALSPEAHAAINANRAAVANGTARGVSVDEALREFKLKTKVKPEK